MPKRILRPVQPAPHRPEEPARGRSLAVAPFLATGPLIAAALLLVLVAACGEPARTTEPPSVPDGDVVLDLVASFPVASVSGETAVVDLGTPDARALLVSGWDKDEASGDETYVWGVGAASVLEFFVADPTDVVLGLEGRPMVFDDAPEQVVTVSWNGEALAEVPLRADLARYEVEVPARALCRGSNRLELGYAWHRTPREVVAGAEDPRSLAVRWHRIELQGLGPGGAPRVDGSDASGPDRIVMPFGTVVAYSFDTEASSELVVDAVESGGAGAGDARVTIRTRSGDRRSESQLDLGEVDSPWRVALDTAGAGLDRVELVVTARPSSGLGGWLRRRLGPPARGGALTLVRPRIRSLEAVAETAPIAAEVARGGRPNVIIYLIDTLRADHLGVYGYPRPTSPNIDRFAQDSVLFLDASAHSSWTRPSVVSLLTGLLPPAHGVQGRADKLPASVRTLAEMLGEQGYETLGLVTNGNVGPTFGLDRGFSYFRHLRESTERPEMHRLSDHLNEWIFRFLDNRADDPRPFFLYAHATDPHLPYTPPEPFRRRFAAGVDPAIGQRESARAITSTRGGSEETRAALVDLYDGEIAFNDHHFGRLLADLRQRGLYDSSLIVLAADHGEEFLDHGGWEHGKTLYSEQLHVPLILKLPGGAGAGTRVATSVSQVDVLPTILDLLAIDPPAVIDGRSLLRPRSAGRPSFAALALSGRELRSVTARGWKLILDDSEFTHSEPVELYHLTTDPREERQLSRDRPFELQALSQILGRLELDLVATQGSEAEIHEDLRRQLEALGYL